MILLHDWNCVLKMTENEAELNLDEVGRTMIL